MKDEPLYNLDTKQWDKLCPCIRAEQRDPECSWHGREASEHCGRCGDPIEESPGHCEACRSELYD